MTKEFYVPMKMLFSRDYRKSVISWQLEQLRRLGLSDKTVGFFIRAAHVHTPVYIILYLMYIGDVWGSVLVIALLFFGFAYFIMFDGCVLSKLEQKLDSEDITIVDPFLELAKFEKNNQNRMRLSLGIGVGYVIFCIMIVYHRFTPPGFPPLLDPL
jgi:hypothetical protein